jgi:hypothetical protein
MKYIYEAAHLKFTGPHEIRRLAVHPTGSSTSWSQNNLAEGSNRFHYPRISFRRAISTQALTLRETTTAPSARAPIQKGAGEFSLTWRAAALLPACRALEARLRAARYMMATAGKKRGREEVGGELWVVLGAGVEAEAKLPGYFLAEEERRRGEKDVGGL